MSSFVLFFNDTLPVLKKKKIHGFLFPSPLFCFAQKGCMAFEAELEKAFRLPSGSLALTCFWSPELL